MDRQQRYADNKPESVTKHVPLGRTAPLSAEPGVGRTLPTRLADDRGDVPTMFVSFSLTMLVFFMVAHFTLVFYGRSVLSAAAQDGLAAAQLEDGTVADGQAAISQTLALSSNVELTAQPSVTIDGTNSVVRVQMSGRVTTALLPLVDAFSIELVGPKERFYSEDERS